MSNSRCHILPALASSLWSTRIAEKPYVVIDMSAPLYYSSPDGKYSSVEHTSYGPMSLSDAIKVGTVLNDGTLPRVFDKPNWYDEQVSRLKV